VHGPKPPARGAGCAEGAHGNIGKQAASKAKQLAKQKNKNASQTSKSKGKPEKQNQKPSHANKSKGKARRSKAEQVVGKESKEQLGQKAVGKQLKSKVIGGVQLESMVISEEQLEGKVIGTEKQVRPVPPSKAANPESNQQRGSLAFKTVVVAGR
jgi:hypothetical protein